MGRTQNIGAIFSMTQTGNLNPPDVNGDPIGAAWCIARPPESLVQPGDPRYGNWTVHFRMRGPAREIYRLRNDGAFPFWNQPGLWDELASHRVRDLVAEVESFGPSGIRYFEEYLFEDWLEQKPYLAELTGDAAGVLRLSCGVANQGFHTVTATLFGEPFPWQPFFERIEDQHSPPSGQFAEISVTETAASVTVNSGGDERFNALVEADFELPLRARDLRLARTDFSVAAGTPNWNTTNFSVMRFRLEAQAGIAHDVVLDRFAYAGHSRPMVCVMFDDGYTTVATAAKPIMDAAGIPGTVAVIASRVGTNLYMTVEQLKQLQADGWSMVNHSADHLQSVLPTGTIAQATDQVARGAQFFARPGAQPGWERLDLLRALWRVGRELPGGCPPRGRNFLSRDDRHESGAAKLSGKGRLARRAGSVSVFCDCGKHDARPDHRAPSSLLRGGSIDDPAFPRGDADRCQPEHRLFGVELRRSGPLLGRKSRALSRSNAAGICVRA